MSDTMPELIFNGGFITIETANGTRAFVKQKSSTPTTTLTIQQALNQGVIRELMTGDGLGYKFNYKEKENPHNNVEGVEVGDLWLNNQTGKIFVCTDATPGANKWVCEGKELTFGSDSEVNSYGSDALYKTGCNNFINQSDAKTFGVGIAPPDLAKKLKMVGKPNFTLKASPNYGQYIGFNYLGKQIGEFIFIPTIFINKNHYETNKGFKVEYGAVEMTCDMACDKSKFVPMDAFIHKGVTSRGFFISKYCASLDKDGYFVSVPNVEPCFVGEYFMDSQRGIANAVGYANDEYKTSIKSIIAPLKNQKLTIPHIQQYEVLHFIAFLATHGTNPIKVPTAKISNMLTGDENATVLQNKTGVVGIHPTYVSNNVGYSHYHKDANWSMVKVPVSKQETNLGQKMVKIPICGGIDSSLAHFTSHNRRLTGVLDMTGGIGEISWGINNNQSNPQPNSKLKSKSWKKCDVTNHNFYNLDDFSSYKDCDAPNPPSTKGNISTIFESTDLITASSNMIRQSTNGTITSQETINGIKKTPIFNITTPVRKEDANQNFGTNQFFDCNAITRVDDTLGAVPIFHLGIDTEMMRPIKLKFENGEASYVLSPGVSERSVHFTSMAQVPNSTSDNYLKQNTGTYAFRLMMMDN